jgi:hypothetical protein
MKKSNDKHILSPPYKLNTMLIKNPLFTTTHLSDYISPINNKFSKIKSRYKNKKIRVSFIN